jgi:hypothetical protein
LSRVVHGCPPQLMSKRMSNHGNGRPEPRAAMRCGWLIAPLQPQGEVFEDQFDVASKERADQAKNRLKNSITGG